MPISSYTDFSGGKNLQVGPVVVELTPGQQSCQFSFDAQNFQLTPFGLLKFPGFQSVLASVLGHPISGGFEYKTSTGVKQMIVCCNGAVYSISGSTATSLYTGGTPGTNYQGVVWQNLLLLMNGVDKVLVYNGSTVTTASMNDPGSIWNDFRPQGAAVFRGRVFYWGDPNNPTKIITPQPQTYNNFDNTTNLVDGFDLEPGYGGKITGMKVLTNDLCLIYKERNIRQLSGSAPFGSTSDPFTFTVVSDELGCVAPRSIVQVGLDQYFMSSNGLKNIQPVFLYGNVQDKFPAYPIQSEVNTWNFTDSAIFNACCAYDQVNTRVVQGVPSGGNTQNNLFYDYNVMTGANEPRGLGINAASVWYYNGQIYHGDYNGQIYQHGSTDGYNGAQFEGYWTSRYIAHGGLGIIKAYRQLSIYADSTNGNADLIVGINILRRGLVEASNDTESLDAGGSIWDVADWDVANWSTGVNSTFEIKNLGRGKAIQLQISNTSNNQQPNIRAIDMRYDFFGSARG